MQAAMLFVCVVRTATGGTCTNRAPAQARGTTSNAACVAVVMWWVWAGSDWVGRNEFGWADGRCGIESRAESSSRPHNPRRADCRFAWHVACDVCGLPRRRRRGAARARRSRFASREGTIDCDMVKVSRTPWSLLSGRLRRQYDCDDPSEFGASCLRTLRELASFAVRWVPTGTRRVPSVAPPPASPLVYGAAPQSMTLSRETGLTDTLRRTQQFAPHTTASTD